MYDGVLTEPTLLDLFRSQSKYRKQFNHYFDDDIRHYRSRRDRRIDLQTLQEIPQALKEVEQCIVTRRNPSSSLACSYITGEHLRGIFEERTSRSVSIPASNALAGGKGT